MLNYGYNVAFCCIIMAAGAVLLIAQSGKINARDQKATEAVADARKALGGDKNIDDIKSLVLTGTIKYSAISLENEIEIRILLPDNYLWITKSKDGVTNYRGVSKGESLNVGFRGKETIVAPLFSPEDELNRLALLLMGVLMKNVSVAPLSISSVSGTSDKFSVANATGTAGEIGFDPRGKYPLHISFKDIVQFPPQTIVDPKTKFRVTNVVPTGPGESTMRFKDRFAVDGVMFPKTIVIESRGGINEGISEVRFEKIQTNPKLTLSDFEIPQ